jgi:integrase
MVASFPDFKNKQLHEITPWLVEKWRSQRLKSDIKPSTINRELTDLKSCFQKAVEWKILKSHPIKEVKLSRVDNNAAPRYLSDTEETKLMEAIDTREQELVQARNNGNAWRKQRNYKLLPDLSQLPYADHLKPMFLLSLNTGMRRGEVFHLQWSQVDLEAKRVTVSGSTAKSGKTRHIPLNQTAVTVLRQWQEQCPTEQVYVFENDGNPFNNVSKAWNTVFTNSGIPHFRWHDIRHTFASRLVMAGVDLNTVRELLGHSNYEMTLRYAHLAPEHKANAVERLVKHEATVSVRT